VVLSHFARGKQSSLANFHPSTAEREVKKATRDLNQLLNNLEPLNKIETVQRKYSELLADMKKLERDHAKNKKRADLLQKEADKAKSENSKTNTLKDKLEKLCRELTKENKKMKVRTKIYRITVQASG
jgi:DNA repair ATPase RecN